MNNRSIYVREDLDEWLDQRSDETGESVSEIVRQALRHYREQEVQTKP